VSFRLLAVACTAALVAVGIVTGATATTTAVPKLRGNRPGVHDLAQERAR
jgi:hypothetical protein